MELNTIITDKLTELKSVLLNYSILVEVNEDGLENVQEKVSALLKQERVTPSFFRTYQLHFLYFIGEVFIRTYGGEWILKDEKDINESYPLGIRCANGLVNESFIGWFLDIFHEEDGLIALGEYKMDIPYSDLKYICSGKSNSSKGW